MALIEKKENNSNDNETPIKENQINKKSIFEITTDESSNESSPNQSSDESIKKQLLIGKKRNTFPRYPQMEIIAEKEKEEEEKFNSEKDELINLRPYNSISFIDKKIENKLSNFKLSENTRNSFSTMNRTARAVTSLGTNSDYSKCQSDNLLAFVKLKEEENVKEKSSSLITEVNNKGENDKSKLELTNLANQTRSINKSDAKEFENNIIPVKKFEDNDKNALLKNQEFLQVVLKEKLKKDFFGEGCTLSLEQMLRIIKTKKSQLHHQTSQKENTALTSTQENKEIKKELQSA